MIALLQLAGTRASGRIQEAMSLIKAVAFTALVVALFASAPVAGPALQESGPTPISLVAIAHSLQLAIGAYDGWQSGSNFAGEDTWPSLSEESAAQRQVRTQVWPHLEMNRISNDMSASGSRHLAPVDEPANRTCAGTAAAINRLVRDTD